VPGSLVPEAARHLCRDGISSCNSYEINEAKCCGMFPQAMKSSTTDRHTRQIQHFEDDGFSWRATATGLCMATLHGKSLL
jgi:hypothetical protein